MNTQNISNNTVDGPSLLYETHFMQAGDESLNSIWLRRPYSYACHRVHYTPQGNQAMVVVVVAVLRVKEQDVELPFG